MTDLSAWVGKSEHRTELIGAVPVRLLAATLDRDLPVPGPGTPIPPMWHWLYFLPDASRSDLGDDGHPRRGGFLPPVPLRRRMFAGGTTRFIAPITIGASVRRSARIISVEEKEGRTGPLILVEAAYEYSTEAGLAVAEEQTLVYTDAPPRQVPRPAGDPPTAPWQRSVATDPAFLFRFSALTFNSHRIHYDAPYATAVEGYPALVVHGPLVALLLLDLATSNGMERVGGFSFQARAPFYVGDRLELRGAPTPSGANLAAYTGDGLHGMSATVTG
ncbi:MAG: MaoC family dehydratase N-terminal domain-containing protein [Acidimicrobiia bacterium]|nr:MaoC family dehydratase N-terminal domain-containing protein [Acidimicrobiia bacterium]MDH5616475.1 MaoC family dehydratase N-terminal domain-containing protein [Acidimicrobiia bacterium]